MTQYATWASYGGYARIWLALGLLAAAGAAVLAGLRLPLPVRFAPPGPRGRAALLSAWAVSLLALLIVGSIYLQRVLQDIRTDGLSAPVPKETILPVTLGAAAALFVFILTRRTADRPTRLASAAIGAMAAPMIFELPFDPIVITRIHWLPVPHPVLFHAVLYALLLLVQVTTLLLLRLSPMARLTRGAFFALALMLAVWALWALAGFGYPSAPAAIGLNIASKLLAFVAALTLFLPGPPEPRPAPEPAGRGQVAQVNRGGDHREVQNH